MDKADYATIQNAIKQYPRHLVGRIIQQGGVNFLRDDVHRWYVSPQRLYDCLAMAEAWWQTQKADAK